MPNWVMNRVKIEKKGVIQKCINTNDDNEEYFDFNKVIDRPKSLSLVAGGSENIAISYALSKRTDIEKERLCNIFKTKKLDFYGSCFDKFVRKEREYTQKDYKRENKCLKEKLKDEKNNEFEVGLYKELGIKDLEDLGNTYINNILQYGYADWYDWSCNVWGTKWNSTETYVIDDNNVEFETAWSTPYGVLQELSKKYNTRVEVEYADEDMGNNCGRLVFENGNEIDYEVGDLEFACNVWGYDYQEYLDEMKEWEKEE